MKYLAITIILCSTTILSAADWLGFRNTSGTSTSADATPPTTFTEQELTWKAALPGKGVSSPIVVGNRVIVTASSGSSENRLHVLCFNSTDGQQLWERQYWATGRTLCHPTSAVAANTPASDGQRIYAFYSSNDLVALDLDGNLLWFRGLAVDYPTAGNDVGMSSSVAIAKQAVIIQSESQGDSFVLGLNPTTGETLWRVNRKKEAHWASPIVTQLGQQELVLVTNEEGLIALDPATGKELWRNELKCDGISSVTVKGDIAYVPGGGLRAVKFGATGSPEVLWNSAKLAAGSASPVLHDNLVMTINRAGVLTAATIDNGESAWQVRLKGQFWPPRRSLAKHSLR